MSIEEKISTTLENILRLLAVIATKGLKQHEQIILLNQAGFQPKEIAALIGTTSNTVRVALSAFRKSKGSKKARLKRYDEEQQTLV